MVAVDEVLVHVRITVLQLWLGVSFFLSAWPLTDCGKHTSPPEVVIPLRITGDRKGMWALGWLAYSLDFGGQRHIVHMKAKTFLVSRHLSVFTYTDQGALREDHPFVQSDCYYHGYVEGDAESIVALTTCFGGFQGTLQIKDKAYEIEPKTPSSTFEHLVYRMNSGQELLPMRCGLTEEIAQQMKLQDSDNTTLQQSNSKEWWTHKQYLDMALIIDYHRFLYRESNISVVLQEIFIVVNEINSIFSTLDVELILPGVEIWNKENPVKMSNISILLSTFCFWKSNSLDRRIRNDIAHLFIDRFFGIYLGLAYIGGVCKPHVNCGVDRLMGDDLHRFAHIVAHELGHNLGMKHDDSSCECGLKLCLMSPTENDAKRFSNCSYDGFWNIYATASCLRKLHKPGTTFRAKFCGNGIVDDGEECDCGSSVSCLNDPCCEVNCTLSQGAECDSGLCCNNCLFKSSGNICREANSECDLPEWCNGTSHVCPEDVYMLAGSPCKDGGYCYRKRCNNRDEQCQTIFGMEAKSAPESCYREVNTRGDRFGNCGIIRNAYVICNMSDVLCGRVQCENVTEIPLLRDHSTIQWSHLNNGITCWGTDYHFGMTIPDLGDVKDGTECGPQQVCMKKKCVPKALWASTCTQEGCNMKGICNNKHHCHCQTGWSPPLCLVQGYGGSVDSGPPLVSENMQSRLFWILIFPLSFCISSFTLIIWHVIAYRKKNDTK